MKLLTCCLTVLLLVSCSSAGFQAESSRKIASAEPSADDIGEGAKFRYCAMCANKQVPEAIRFFEVAQKSPGMVIQGIKRSSSGEQTSVSCDVSYSAEENTFWGWGHASCSDGRAFTVFQTLRDAHQGISVASRGTTIIIGLEHDRGSLVGHWVALPRERAFLVIDSATNALQRVIISSPENNSPLNEKRTTYDLLAK